VNEPLDLAELAAACVAVGWRAGLTDMSKFLWVESSEAFFTWHGEGEYPNLAFAFHDAVRSVLRGSYCAPTLAEPDADGDWPLCVIPRDADMRIPEGVPMLVYGRTETECWARALVALFRAGLIREGRG